MLGRQPSWPWPQGSRKKKASSTAVLVFVLIGARWLIASRHVMRAIRGGISRRTVLLAAVACAFGAAGVLAWPLGAALRRATSDDDLSGAKSRIATEPRGLDLERLDRATSPCGLALLDRHRGRGLLGRARRSLGLGSDRWLWVLGVAEVRGRRRWFTSGAPSRIGRLAVREVGREVLFAELSRAGAPGLVVRDWDGHLACSSPFRPGSGHGGGRGRRRRRGPTRNAVDTGDVDGGGPGVLHPGT